MTNVLEEKTPAVLYSGKIENSFMRKISKEEATEANLANGIISNQETYVIC